ncbi:MAG: hypothetical protein AAB515_01975 [Patescibacteria group bacterium]
MPEHQHIAHHHFARLFVFTIGAIITAILAATLVIDRKQPATEQSVNCTPLSLAESVAHADLILTGKVFLVVPAEPGYANVLITPQHFYKGTLPALGVRIRALATTEGENIPADDLHFASSKPPYLLFLQQQVDGTYRTSKCVGSRLLGSGLTAAEQLVLETTITVQ